MTKFQAEKLLDQEYKYGFHSDVEAIEFPKGLNESVITRLSKIKDEPQFLLDFRLKAYKYWKKMTEPKWATVSYPPIDFQNIRYYSAPKKKGDGPKVLKKSTKKFYEPLNALGCPFLSKNESQVSP